MRAWHLLSLGTLFACAVDHASPDPMPGGGGGDGSGSGSGTTSPTPLTDTQCAGAPDAGPTTDFRHISSSLIAELAPHHRGIDLIAADDDATQTLGGAIQYGPTDKALEDEDVELFACIASQWKSLGVTTTDGEGRFTFALSGADRLPVGMRDLYLSVTGDRTGAAFVGVVAPHGTPIVVSDIDGTLTASENAYPESLAVGGDVAAQAGAPDALQMLAAKHYLVVYISTRSDRFTQDTRDWFAAKSFPRGPLRLPTAIITLPGADTVAFKAAAIHTLAAFAVTAGFGNRQTDIDAYMQNGLPADRIFVKLPEFTDETAASLAAGLATGFQSYDDLRAQQLTAM